MTRPARLALPIITAILGAAAITRSAWAAPDPKGAADIFGEAKAISDRDGGRFWGQRLYGPMLIVGWKDLSAVANAPDAQGVLKPIGAFFAGRLPSSVPIANAPIEWSDKRWTELIWPLMHKSDVATTGDDWRYVMLAHEMFHRIQPAVGLTRPEIPNAQLDSLEGRYLPQLEWRALAKALSAPDAAGRRAAIADALLFRAERYRRFPDAASAEANLEINEGIAEYTGVMLGLADPKARTRYALYDLGAFVGAPTFVRSFAYATGPAYGLLLDQADPAWRGKLGSGRRLDELLAAGLRLPAPDFAALDARAAVYDAGGGLHASEVERDRAKQARLAALKASLVDGPVLRVPLHHADYQFNPETLLPLGDYGTVYPTLTLNGPWGELKVERGGALFDKAEVTAAVPAAGVDPSNPRGDGWRLTLKPGWSVRPGPRKSDLVVEPDMPR
jgi:hypothetical protein